MFLIVLLKLVVTEHCLLGVTPFFLIGAFVIWNPPQSPDLNLIEKFWDVALSRMSRLTLQLSLGLHGPPRRLNYVDLKNILMSTTLSYHSLSGCGYDWLCDSE